MCFGPEGVHGCLEREGGVGINLCIAVFGFYTNTIGNSDRKERRILEDFWADDCVGFAHGCDDKDNDWTGHKFNKRIPLYASIH